MTKESCEENPYSVWVAALVSTTVLPFAVDHLQVDQSVSCSLSVSMGFLGQQGSHWHLLMAALPTRC